MTESTICSYCGEVSRDSLMVHNIGDCRDTMKQRIASLERDHKLMRETLEYYSDEDNWREIEYKHTNAPQPSDVLCGGHFLSQYQGWPQVPEPAFQNPFPLPFCHHEDMGGYSQ